MVRVFKLLNEFTVIATEIKKNCLQNFELEKEDFSKSESNKSQGFQF